VAAPLDVLVAGGACCGVAEVPGAGAEAPASDAVAGEALLAPEAIAGEAGGASLPVDAPAGAAPAAGAGALSATVAGCAPPLPFCRICNMAAAPTAMTKRAATMASGFFDDFDEAGTLAPAASAAARLEAAFAAATVGRVSAAAAPG
jgi:hypothetical protein